MRTVSKLTLVTLLLLTVLTVFISPAVDLQPTALRALQAANMLFAALALAGHLLAADITTLISWTAGTSDLHLALPRTEDILELNCTRLC
jgi:hypothetical protein